MFGIRGRFFGLKLNMLTWIAESRRRTEMNEKEKLRGGESQRKNWIRQRGCLMDGLFLQREREGGTVFGLPPCRLHGCCCEVRLVGQSNELRRRNRPYSPEGGTSLPPRGASTADFPRFFRSVMVSSEAACGSSG